MKDDFENFCIDYMEIGHRELSFHVRVQFIRTNDFQISMVVAQDPGRLGLCFYVSDQFLGCQIHFCLLAVRNIDPDIKKWTQKVHLFNVSFPI